MEEQDWQRFDNHIDEIVDLARDIYVHSDQFTAQGSFSLAKTFFEVKVEFLKEIEQQKKAALATTPEQQENDGGKVPQPTNSTQI